MARSKGDIEGVIQENFQNRQTATYLSRRYYSRSSPSVPNLSYCLPHSFCMALSSSLSRGFAGNGLASQISNFWAKLLPMYPIISVSSSIREWLDAAPTRRSITHAIWYQEPEKYIRHTVIVVGGAASGTDIATQVLPYAKEVSTVFLNRSCTFSHQYSVI